MKPNTHIRNQTRKTWPLFFSASVMIVSLLTVALVTMEQRRIGYEIVKLERNRKSLQDQYRIKTVSLAERQRPEKILAIAQTHLQLKHARSDQLIHLFGKGQPRIQARLQNSEHHETNKRHQGHEILVSSLAAR